MLEFNGKTNNIVTMSSQLTQRNQFNIYKAYSQASIMYYEFQGTSFGSGSENLQNAITFQEGVSTNSNIRTGRHYTFVADTPLVNNDTATNYANWENNYRQSQGFQYQATVASHTYDGTNIWTPNTLIKVKDDFANVDAILLIDSVMFTESIESGLITKLNLVWQDAYSLTITEDYRASLANVRQQNFTAIVSS